MFMKTICCLHFEPSQKLKQFNLIYLDLLWKEKQSLFVCNRHEFFGKNTKLNKYKRSKQTCHILHHVKSNLIIPLNESWKHFFTCCAIFLTYIFLNLCRFHSRRSAILLISVRWSTNEPKWRARNHWWTTLHFAVFAFFRV